MNHGNGFPAPDLNKKKHQKGKGNKKYSVSGTSPGFLVMVHRLHQVHPEGTFVRLKGFADPCLREIPIQVGYLPVCGEPAFIHNPGKGKEASVKTRRVPGGSQTGMGVFAERGQCQVVGPCQDEVQVKSHVTARLELRLGKRNPRCEKILVFDTRLGPKRSGTRKHCDVSL